MNGFQLLRNVLLATTLMVYFASSINSQDKFKSIPTTVRTENESVLLPCYVDDESSITSIQWYKDNMIIASTSINVSKTGFNDRLKLCPNGSLEITRLLGEDSGEYECQISKGDPLINMAQSYNIEVMYPPIVKLTPDIHTINVRLNEIVDLNCEAHGVPTPSVTWYANGTELKLITKRTRLHFNASSRHLAGIYECHVQNVVRKVVKSIVVNIQHPPELTSDKTWIHSSPGFRAEMDCHVNANPVASIVWFKYNESVHFDSRVVTTMLGANVYSLIIRNVRTVDFGNYSCRARNELGEAVLEFQLAGVPNLPTFKHEPFPSPDDDSKNDSFTLVWEVDSYTPIFEYNLYFRKYSKQNTAHEPEWKKMIVPVERSASPLHTKSYTIFGLTPKTIYEATLHSRNRFGWSNPSPKTIFATTGVVLSDSAKEDLDTRLDDNVLPVEVAKITLTELTSSSVVTSSTYLYVVFIFLFVQI